MRSSGILMPIFSLPSKYGIGCLSKEAYNFVDFLKESGQTYWQILPIGPTSYGDSPYQSFSTFAGNPYFIDLEEFIEEGTLSKDECESCYYGDNVEYVDYEKIYNTRFKLLKTAYTNSVKKTDNNFTKFKSENAKWLNDYALFMALKDKFNGKSWLEWDKSIKKRDTKVISEYTQSLHEEINFYMFLQYKFFIQWKKLKDYANKNNVKIVGDIPIYVAVDSADTWANPELFQFDNNYRPSAVAGCPPDPFAPTGQLWGNPLYDWNYHKKTGFKWWCERILHCQNIYDMVRIDHFRGFDEYYSISATEKTAENGKWKKGPNYSLFKELNKCITSLDVIAEDLGFMTETVQKLVKKTGYPGMKILQFAFDLSGESEYLPHNYDRNYVVYTGTHDNETIVGWFKHQCTDIQKFALDYMNVKYETEIVKTTVIDKKTNEEKTVEIEQIKNIDELLKTIHFDFIRLAMMSSANICIIPMHDYLGLDNSARINIPSTLGNNWKWRMKNDALTKKLAAQINALTKLSERKVDIQTEE